jgi:hypothetical protein
MPIPGLTRVDYTGITASNLDQGREYLEVALGVEYPPRVCFFRTGGQALLEVFEAFLRNPQAPR